MGEPGQPAFHAVEVLPFGQLFKGLAGEGVRGRRVRCSGPLLIGESPFTSRQDGNIAETLQRALVGDIEGGDSLNLVTKQFDSHRFFEMRQPDVDDVTARRNFTAVFNLGFPAISVGDQPANKFVAIEFAADREVSGLARRRQSLEERANRGHHELGSSVWNREASTKLSSPTHDRNVGANAFKRRDVPRGPLGYQRIIAEPTRDVIGEVVGLSLRRHDRQGEWRVLNESSEARSNTTRCRGDKAFGEVGCNLVSETMQQRRQRTRLASHGATRSRDAEPLRAPTQWPAPRRPRHS